MFVYGRVKSIMQIERFETASGDHYNSIAVYIIYNLYQVFILNIIVLITLKWQLCILHKNLMNKYCRICRILTAPIIFVTNRC